MQHTCMHNTANGALSLYQLRNNTIKKTIMRPHEWPYLELLIEEAHGGDPCSDDSQEGGGNDGHGPLYAAQAQQQRLSDPAGT